MKQVFPVAERRSLMISEISVGGCFIDLDGHLCKKVSSSSYVFISRPDGLMADIGVGLYACDISFPVSREISPIAFVSVEEPSDE